MNLKFDLRTANDCGAKDHPQKVMKDLGITYQHSTPQSISDEWWFWNCENLPKELPKYLKVFTVDPMKCIGWGLSEREAKEITEYDPTMSETMKFLRSK